LGELVVNQLPGYRKGSGSEVSLTVVEGTVQIRKFRKRIRTFEWRE
jgi:hypothetical protein